MKKIWGIFFLIFCPFQTSASIQLKPPRILELPSSKLDAPTNPHTDDSPGDQDKFSAGTLLKTIEDVIGPEHPEMFERWQKYLRTQNLDPENEEKTFVRLQRQYLDSIQRWGEQVSECDSTRSSGRWLRRLKRKFGAYEVNLHKKDIAKIITSLYLKRKNECMQKHEEVALRAEREIYAFSIERTRLLIDFISQNSAMHISNMNKLRLLAVLRRKQNSHTLSERTVDLNALRLETKLQNLSKDYVEFLAHEQSFKKPFDLHKNLSLLSSEYLNETPAKKNKASFLRNESKQKQPKKLLDLNLTKTAS